MHPCKHVRLYMYVYKYDSTSMRFSLYMNVLVNLYMYRNVHGHFGSRRLVPLSRPAERQPLVLLERDLRASVA